MLMLMTNRQFGYQHDSSAQRIKILLLVEDFETGEWDSICHIHILIWVSSSLSIFFTPFEWEVQALRCILPTGTPMLARQTMSFGHKNNVVLAFIFFSHKYGIIMPTLSMSFECKNNVALAFFIFLISTESLCLFYQSKKL